MQISYHVFGYLSSIYRTDVAENRGQGPPPSGWGGFLEEPPRPSWMRSDPALQRVAILEAFGRPLNTALAELSSRMGVRLWTAADLAEFRVTLRTRPEPVWKLMARLQDVMSHGDTRHPGCYWDRRPGEGQAVSYTRRRDLQGKRLEEALRDSPRRTARQWLQDLRDYSRIPAEARSRFSTTWPYLRRFTAASRRVTDCGDPVTEAVASLSDPDFDRLFGMGRTGALAARFSTESRRALSSGPGARPDRPMEAPFLNLTEEHGRAEGRFLVSLYFERGTPGYAPSALSLNTLGVVATGEDVEELENARKQESGPEVDLLRSVTRPDGADPGAAPRLTLIKALELLAGEARIPTYAEVFLRALTVLPATRGKPEYLLSQICRAFGCQWRRMGSDHIVWSKSWAQDRIADVPQPLVNRLGPELERSGRFSFPAILEMSRLREEQARTLESLFGRSVIAPFPPNRSAIRFVASLPDTAVRAAFTRSGLNLDRVTAVQADLLRDALGVSEIALPVRVTLELRPAGVGVTLRDSGGARVSRWAYLGESPTPMP